MKTLVSWNPSQEIRSMEEVFDRLFGSPRTAPGAALLPVDVLEKENKLVVRAAVPGVKPEELDIQIEKNVLTIKGETRHEVAGEDTKIYRREVSYGAFARSIRLPENLNLDDVDAQFENGIVTIAISKVEEPKPLSIKVNVRPSEQTIA